MTFKVRVVGDVVGVDPVRAGGRGQKLLTWRMTAGHAGSATHVVCVLHGPSPAQIAQIHPGAVVGVRGRGQVIVQAGVGALLLTVEAIEWARAATPEQTMRELYT